MTLRTLQRYKTASGAAYTSVGEGEPLLLVHGVGLQLDAWRLQIKAFSATHRVIAVDMPGHGDSLPLLKGSQINDFVAWLKDVVDDLGCSSVNLCGHSMGALIVKGFALTHPELVRRAALICGVYRRGAAARDAVIARATEIANGRMDIEGPLIRWYNQDKEHEREAAAMTREWLQQVPEGGYITAYSAFAEGDAVYADRLSELSCPSLFLAGEFDPNSTPKTVADMAAQVSNSRAVVIPNEKHMVHLVRPDAVNSELRSWLAEPA